MYHEHTFSLAALVRHQGSNEKCDPRPRSAAQSNAGSGPPGPCSHRVLRLQTSAAAPPAAFAAPTAPFPIQMSDEFDTWNLTYPHLSQLLSQLYMLEFGV